MPATVNELSACLGVIAGATREELNQIRLAHNARLRELSAHSSAQWHRRQAVEFTDTSGRVIRGTIKTVNEKTCTIEGCRYDVFGGGSIAMYTRGVRVPFHMLRVVRVAPTPGGSQAAAAQVVFGPEDGDEDRL